MTSRRLSLLALSLYAVVAVADMAVHLADDARAGRDWRTPGNIAVAFSAGLFWPADLIAGMLLGR